MRIADNETSAAQRSSTRCVYKAAATPPRLNGDERCNLIGVISMAGHRIIMNNSCVGKITA